MLKMYSTVNHFFNFTINLYLLNGLNIFAVANN